MVSFNVLLSLAIMEDVFVFRVFFLFVLFWLFKLQLIFQTAISLVEPHLLQLESSRYLCRRNITRRVRLVFCCA